MFGQYCIQRGHVGGRSKFGTYRLIAKGARYPGQCFEMFDAGLFWRQQRKYQVDRPTVDGIEIDGLIQPFKQADNTFKS